MPSINKILITWVDDSPMYHDGVRIETGETVSLPASIARGFIANGQAIEGIAEIEVSEDEE